MIITGREPVCFGFYFENTLNQCKMYHNLLSLFLVVVLSGASFNLHAQNDVSKKPDKNLVTNYIAERHPAFLNVKRAKLVIKESYGDMSIGLPFERDMSKLLQNAGIIVDNLNYDIIVNITASGYATGREYRSSPGVETKLSFEYSGFNLNGDIVFETKTGKKFVGSFTGSIAPPMSIGRKYSLYQAPFMRAFDEAIPSLMAFCYKYFGITFLFASMDDKAENIREKAAIMLGEIKSKQAVEPLVLALKYEDSYRIVRKQLEIIDPNWMHSEANKNAVPKLIASLKDNNKNVRGQVAKVLGEIKDNRAVEPLCIYLHDIESSVREQAALALMNIKDTRSVEPLIGAFVFLNNYEVLKRALDTIEPDWMRKEVAKNAVPLYISYLKANDEKYRLEAVKALGIIKDKSAVGPLILALKEDHYVNVKDLAAEALISINDSSAVEPLVNIALKHESDYARIAAAGVLIGIKDKRSVELLISALKDDDRFVRSRAAYILGETGDKRAIEPLINTLAEKNNYADVKKALEKIEPKWVETEAAKNTAPTFIVLLNSVDKNIRKESAMALGKIEDGRAVDPLINALKDVDADVREQAAVALGKIKDNRAVEPLIEALSDNEEDVCEMSVWALGRIKDKRAVKPLTKLLKIKNCDYHFQVALALEEITGEKSPVEEYLK
jgi:HEAT repeat protein